MGLRTLTSHGAARHGRLRHWLANASLALAASVLFLAGVEAAARMYVRRCVEGWPGTISRPLAAFDAAVGWVNPPGASAVIQRPEFRVHQVINSHGLRGPDCRYDKTAGTARVLLLGNSFMQAAAVEEQETVRALLERRLNDRHDRPWEVINAGTPGYSTDQEYLFYVREGRRYQPDVVVLEFYYNDLLGLLSGDEGKPFFVVEDGVLVLRNSPVSAPPPGWLRGRRSRFTLRPWHGSYALRLLSLRTAGANPELHRLLARIGLTEPYESDLPPPEMWVYGLGHRAEVEEMWRRMEALLAALHDRVRSDHARMVVLYAPAAFECDQRAWDLTRRRYRMGPRWQHDRAIARLEAVAAALALPLVDPRPELRAAIQAGRRPYFLQDGHWTALGQSVVADKLEQAISR